jgi:hypothetical protein
VPLVAAGGLGCLALLFGVTPLRARASVSPEAIQQRGVLVEVVGAAIVCVGGALARLLEPLPCICGVVPRAALLEQLILDSHAGVRLPRRSVWTGRARRESSERETRRGQS